ncbi:MAG: hypothetical protein OCD76_11345 [Reichenbachiella sp.]
MSIRSEYIEQLESYFNGEMQGADRLLFEGKVESNPMLKEEFESQNQIVEALKNQRRTELKTRLNNVSLEPSLIGGLLQSSAFKPLVYAVTGVAVSVSSFMYYNTDSTIKYHIENLNSKSNYFLESTIGVHEDADLDYRYEYTEVLYTDENLSQAEETVVVPLPAKTTGIQFEVPKVDDHMSDDFTSNRMVVFEGVKGIDNVPSVSKMDRVSIQTINSRRYGFHYKMEDNKLFLYGKFGESPYEIIEINSPGAKNLFFYYNGEFFGLDKSASEITPLAKIKNQNLIEELDSIKNANKI